MATVDNTIRGQCGWDSLNCLFAVRLLQLYCDSEEGRKYFTTLAVKYALEDQLEEIKLNYEGRVSH